MKRQGWVAAVLGAVLGLVIAGGMESMTNAPYLLANARSGYRYGDGTLHDSMLFDGLTCGLEDIPMGLSTERYAKAAGLAREPQDAVATDRLGLLGRRIDASGRRLAEQ